jgi:hypothetical protein
VGCRRRPAILCLPTKNSPLNADDDEADDSPRGGSGGRRRPPKCPPSPAPHEKPLRVLPGGWAEFYCSDAGGVGRIYYFHGITGQRSWKPPRVKKIGRDGGQSDKSDSEVMREFSLSSLAFALFLFSLKCMIYENMCFLLTVII